MCNKLLHDYTISLLKVSESITKQERIIAETQDLYQPFIQERGGSGGAREEALKSIASVSFVQFFYCRVAGACVNHFLFELREIAIFILHFAFTGI